MHSFIPSLLPTVSFILQVFSQSYSEQVFAFHSFIQSFILMPFHPSSSDISIPSTALVTLTLSLAQSPLLDSILAKLPISPKLPRFLTGT